MRKIPITLSVLLLCLLSTVAIPASVSMTQTSALQQSPEPGTLLQPAVVDMPSAVLTATQVLTNTFAYLPVTMNYHRVCGLDSPYSITISALHEVVPTGVGTFTTRSLTEAEWLALYEEAFPTLVSALRHSGACWSRVGINWSWIQPNPPPADYVWGPYHDEKLALVAESGVHLIGTVGSVPYWAGGDPYPGEPCTAVDATQLPAFVQFLTDLVNRYKEPPWNIHVWELFNEPDGIYPYLAQGGIGCAGERGDLYTQMLAVAYPAIKAADPTATVLMGGLAYDNFTEYGGPFNRYFVDEVMATGGSQYLDATTFHYFPDFYAEWERWVPEGNPPTCGDVEDGVGDAYPAWGVDLIAKTNHFRNRLWTCSGVNKPVWITELAEHGYPGDDVALAQQARYVIQGHTRGFAAGAKNITWFALISTDSPFAQGLLYDDLTPKPAYYAYQTLTSELASWDYARALSVPNVEGYVFHNNRGEEKMVVWASGPAGVPVPLTLAATSQVRIVDRMGAITYVQDGGVGDLDGVVNGSVTIQLPARPVDNDPAPPTYYGEPLFVSK